MKKKTVLQLNNLIPPRVDLNAAKMKKIKERRLAIMAREKETLDEDAKIEATQEPIEPVLPSEVKE